MNVETNDEEQAARSAQRQKKIADTFQYTGRIDI
jgi:hypothetical protein